MKIKNFEKIKAKWNIWCDRFNDAYCPITDVREVTVPATNDIDALPNVNDIYYRVMFLNDIVVTIVSDKTRSNAWWYSIKTVGGTAPPEYLKVPLWNMPISKAHPIS